MDNRKRKHFSRHPNNQFSGKGSNKKGRLNNSARDRFAENSEPADTAYQILCPSRKIGGVIGKGGNIVKTLREETQAKITVGDSVTGCDERVIIIYSSPTKISRKLNGDNDSIENKQIEQQPMEPHCAAQDALLKVHDRIVADDLFGGMASEDDNDSSDVTARLLVPNTMVGCVLGKGGDVIKRLRSETGANIRVLPADHLPTCAISTDELVQISGKASVAKKALYEISTLLHQNPRKEKLPLSFPMHGNQNFHPSREPIPHMLPPGNPMYLDRNSASRGMPPGPPPNSWMGTDDFDSVLPGRGGEASGEFSMKIVCPADKIGGVIGKGGFNVKQIQQETGASIHVEDASTDADERVIRVSAFEGLWNPRSQTIDAILLLQNKTSEISEKGSISTRLIVPSSKVGCLLGQGGQVINEMRRRTQADIRVFSKEDKPKFASQDEELVQISGNIGVSKDALGEIASRLRARTLRDAKPGPEPAEVPPFQRFTANERFPRGPPPPHHPMRAARSDGYEQLRGGRHEYGRENYPVNHPHHASGYFNMENALEPGVTNYPVSPIMGDRRSEIPETRMNLHHDLRAGRLSGSYENYRPSEYPVSPYRQPASSRHHHHHHLPSYENINSHPSPYQSTHPRQSYYDNSNVQQSAYQSVSVNPHQSPHGNINYPQESYSVNVQQGAYPSTNAPENSYQNYGPQHGTYQY